MEREALQEREREPELETLYDDNFRRQMQWAEIRTKGRILIKGKETPWEDARQGHLKYYLHPRVTDTVATMVAAPWLRMFQHDIGHHSGKHTHQGGLGLFILEGVGVTIVNEVNYPWKPGDLCVLPVTKDLNEHQHFSTDPSGHSIWLAIVPQDMTQMLGAQARQNETQVNWKGSLLPSWYTTPEEEGPSRDWEPLPFTPPYGAPLTMWDELFRLRDKQRAEIAQAPKLLEGDKLPWEINRQGKMKWYLHPELKPRPMSTLLLYVQEIPPGSRSGKVFHQGGRAFFIWEGTGYTIINNKRYDWEKYDLVALPLVPDGVVYQHFNADPEKPARIIGAAPNFNDSLGMDLGVGFEQIENCPEYEEG